MNKTQKIVIGIAALLFALLCVYPPLHFKERYYNGWVWSDRAAIDVARLTLQFFALAVVSAGLTYMAGHHKRAFALVVILIGVSTATFVANRLWSAYQGEQAAKARDAVAAEARATQVREAAAAEARAVQARAATAAEVRAARAREAAAAEARAAQAREAAADEELRSQVREEEAEAAAVEARAAQARQAAKAEAEARRRIPQNELKKISVTPICEKWDVDWTGEGGREGKSMRLQFKNGANSAFYAVKLIVRYQNVLTNENGQYESQDFARLVKIAYPGSNAECYADFDPPPGDDTHAEDRFRLLQITVSAALRPEASSTESAPDLSDSGGVRANKAATQPTVSP